MHRLRFTKQTPFFLDSCASLVWRAFCTEQPVGDGYRGYALAPLRGVSRLYFIYDVHTSDRIIDNKTSRIQNTRI